MLDVSTHQDRVQIGRHFSVTFERTLRIPDDGREYPLPPSLGRFPVRRVEDYADRVPAAWREHGGVFLPMYQREAMWLNFHGAHWRPNALKVARRQGQRALRQAAITSGCTRGDAGLRRRAAAAVAGRHQRRRRASSGSSSRCRSAWATRSRARSRARRPRRAAARRASTPSRAASRTQPPHVARTARRARGASMAPCARAAPAAPRRGDGAGRRWADAAAALPRPARHRHVGSGQVRPGVRAHRQQRALDARSPASRCRRRRSTCAATSPRACRGSTSTTTISATSSRAACWPRSRASTSCGGGRGVVSDAALIGRDGRRYPLTEPRWRGEDGSPLLAAAARDHTGRHRPRGPLALALRAGTAARARAGDARRGVHAAARTKDRRRRPADQARVVQPDGQLQGPRHRR